MSYPFGEGIVLGRFIDPVTRRVGDKLRYTGERSIIIFGPNGSGKGDRLLAPNLFQSVGQSLLVVDPKGELAAMTAPFRRTLGRVVILNPFGVLTDYVGYQDLRSEGYNPLAYLDPSSPSFNADASLLAEAMIEVTGNDPHWGNSARALLAALIMYVVIEARQFGEVPAMTRVRALLCQASGEVSTSKGVETVGLPALAARMMELKSPALSNKASQFVEWTREVQGIASTAKIQTEPFDDYQIASDLARGRFDFGDLKRSPTTVYLILPPHMMARHSKWLRLVITSALNACMRPRGLGEPRVTFILDEFAALGHLPIIENNWAVARGYGVQFMPVFQNLSQLKSIYKDRWETFIGNAGALASFAPNDMTTAEWLSRRAGDTTKIVMGYNIGNSSGSSSGGTTNHGNSSGFSFQQTKVPLFAPHSLYGMVEGTMMVALAGLSNVIAAYAPAVRQIEQCRALARDNPYYTQVPRVGSAPCQRVSLPNRPAVPHYVRPAPVPKRKTISDFIDDGFAALDSFLNSFQSKPQSPPAVAAKPIPYPTGKMRSVSKAPPVRTTKR